MASAKDYGKLWGGVTKATNEAEAVLALAQIVFDKHGRAFTLSLERKDAELCVEILDYVSCDPRLLHVFAASDCLHQGITGQHLKPAEKNAFFLTLRRLVELHELLPDRMMIRETLDVSDEISAAGGFGDVRSGTYNEGPVAVKATRVAARDNLQKIRKVGTSSIFTRAAPTVPLQRFYREVLLWEKLSHPNVLKLVGVQEDIGKRQFVTVSEWMAHGTIMDYIKNNPTNRLDLVRDFIFSPPPPLKYDNSCTGRPRV